MGLMKLVDGLTFKIAQKQIGSQMNRVEYLLTQNNNDHPLLFHWVLLLQQC